MLATHRVKDSNNNTTGFIINKEFINVQVIKDNISSIDNLNIQRNGVIRAKKSLPELYYTDAIKEFTYKKLLANNPFYREVQSELEHWRKVNYKQILQLGGPRQVGKTTEILKFAYKNYKYVIYVNLADDRFNFKNIIKSGSIKVSLASYCKQNYVEYSDTRNTILIIDEIQTSREVYNSLRNLRASLNCDIIVTGSYLGITFNKDGFFLPAGTLAFIDMLPMNFSEVAKVFKLDKVLNSISLYGDSTNGEYNKLEELYQLYRKIGGYPEVIKTYIKTKDIKECYGTISNILRVFKEESRNYFKEPREVEIFESVYNESFNEMCREKRGTGKDSVGIITKLTKNNTDLIVNKNEVSNTIAWLIYTGIISCCDLAIDGDIKNIAKDRRLYFSDCGIAAYIASRSLIDTTTIEGLLTETFVFNELKFMFKESYIKQRVIGNNVCFSTFGSYELDFMVSDTNKVVYGIEVKTKSGNPISLKVFKNKRFIDKGIVAKPSKGGHSDDFDTIPIYTVGCRFPYK